MNKDFDSWNEQKKKIHNETPNFYHEKEIRWCSLGVNVGFEQDGTSKTYQRPVLIIRGFSRHVCLVVPLTTSAKKNKYHIAIGAIGDREAFAVVSQLRLIDTKRLHDRLAILDKEKFEVIRKTIRSLV